MCQPGEAEDVRLRFFEHASVSDLHSGLYGLSKQHGQVCSRFHNPPVCTAVKKEETMDEMEVVFLSDFW